MLRALDAIHVATALLIRDDLEVLVSYDHRMLAAAATHGLPTAAPT
jgi:predicted nucleic acid-binding protein